MEKRETKKKDHQQFTHRNGSAIFGGTLPGTGNTIARRSWATDGDDEMRWFQSVLTGRSTVKDGYLHVKIQESKMLEAISNAITHDQFTYLVENLWSKQSRRSAFVMNTVGAGTMNRQPKTRRRTCPTPTPIENDYNFVLLHNEAPLNLEVFPHGLGDLSVYLPWNIKQVSAMENMLAVETFKDEIMTAMRNTAMAVKRSVDVGGHDLIVTDQCTKFLVKICEPALRHYNWTGLNKKSARDSIFLKTLQNIAYPNIRYVDQFRNSFIKAKAVVNRLNYLQRTRKNLS